MSLSKFAIVFLVLAVSAAAIKLFVEAPRATLLIDVTLMTAVACFLVCLIGHLGRRIAASMTVEDAHDGEGPGSPHG